MTQQTFGATLDPYRRLKDPLGIKGNRQSIVITNNPSTVDENEILTVRFPNLGKDDVIVPGTTRLAFKIDLESTTDPDRTIVGNLGRAIIKKISVKLEGREVMSLNNADIFLLYADLWMSLPKRQNLAYQGIQDDEALKHRIEAGDKGNKKKDIAVANAYGNRFCIPLDFELLNSHMPYYQGALKDRLSYELTFNNYARVIVSSDAEAKYKISGISLEYDVVNHPELARMIAQQYQSKLAIYYERVLHHSTLLRSKADTVWNINLNTPARSLKGILMLFEEQDKPFARSSEKFVNPQIKHLSCTVEGQPNQVYASGYLPYQHFDEIRKYFGCGGLHNDPTTALVCKSLHLNDVRLDEYLTTKYALWIDLRSTDDDKLHGSGRRIENGSEGITIQIDKKQEDDKAIKIYLYVVMDAQLNIESSRLKDIVY